MRDLYPSPYAGELSEFAVLSRCQAKRHTCGPPGPSGSLGLRVSGTPPENGRRVGQGDAFTVFGVGVGFVRSGA